MIDELNAVDGVLLACIVSTSVHLEQRVIANQYKVILVDHLYTMIKPFFRNRGELFQDERMSPFTSRVGQNIE